MKPVHAKPVLDCFIARIETKHHDFDVLLDQIYAGVYLRGALFVELILNDTAEIATNLAVRDPISARFNRTTHVTNGDTWNSGSGKQANGCPYKTTPP